MFLSSSIQYSNLFAYNNTNNFRLIHLSNYPIILIYFHFIEEYVSKVEILEQNGLNLLISHLSSPDCDVQVYFIVLINNTVKNIIKFKIKSQA